jgi:hypothetical protein
LIKARFEMPSSNGAENAKEGSYSILTGFIYVSNLMVGTGTVSISVPVLKKITFFYSELLTMFLIRAIKPF